MIEVTRLYCGVTGTADHLRYAAANNLRQPVAKKPVVVWNCTRRCNLKCVHCYAKATADESAGDLTYDEGLALLEDLAEYGAPVVLFSGGEPLMHPRIFDFIERANKLNLRAVLSTNGTLITPEVADRLREANIQYAGVSIDGMNDLNDFFRGGSGAFAKAVEGIRNCKKAGIKVGLRFTITKHNVHQIPDIFNLLRTENIPRACFYHLVYAGRGTDLMMEDLDHDAARKAMDTIISHTDSLIEQQVKCEILTVDNPVDGIYLYLRMLKEGSPRAAEVLQLLKRNGGNGTGNAIGCVSWDGSVHPNQFWRHLSLGNIRERKFSEIWTDLSNPLLAALKNKMPHVTGRCASCRFLEMCGGGSRVRAEAATGNLWAPDPACYLTDEEISSKNGNSR